MKNIEKKDYNILGAYVKAKCYLKGNAMRQQIEYKDDEIEIDIKDLFFEIIGHWKIIIASTVLVAMIAFVISAFVITPQYESISELYVLSKSTSITSLADVQMGTNLTYDYEVVAQGRPVLEQVISNLELDETYKSLSNKISLNNPTNSRILQITVTDPDPLRAKYIADEIAEVASAFIAEKMDQDPPTIIQRGYADGEPVSPNTLKNTVIGALIGAFISIALVVVSYLLNDTIMTSEDVERKIGLNVLGTLPYEEDKDDGKTKGKKKKRNKKKTK